MGCNHRSFVVACAAAIGLFARSVGAQSSPSTPRDAKADSTARPTPLFTVRDAVIAGGFVGLTIAAFPLDQHIARRLEDPSTQANRFLHHAATGFELIASPGAYVIGGSLYAVGRVGGFERMADLGLHGTEAVLVGDLVTGALKGLAGRARPFVVADSNAADFHLGAGFTNPDRTSFPSGHTTSAFAAAAAVTAETGRWWPRSTWFVGPLMYGGATMVGLSRMYHNRHWASDVALGAAIGTFSGQKVIQFVHARPKNWLDRTLLGLSVMPDGRGHFAAELNIPLR
jgi:membrane-associated phospholipid phosphatase